jgi:hypothetical protein
MSFSDTPVMITCAIFLSLIILDLFRHEYKYLPAHAVIGFFSMLLMSVLCEQNSYFLAWLILLTPFLLIIGAILLRQMNVVIKPAYPLSHLQNQQPKNQPAPYYI